MKIAVVDPAAWSLAYDVPLCESLAAAGHDVTLFTTTFAHGPMPEADGFTIDTWFYRTTPALLPRRVGRGMQHPRDLRRLARHLVAEGFDLVHVQWSVVDRLDVATWRRLPLPVVFTAHNSIGRSEQSLSCEHLRAFDAVVAHSAFGADGLRSECGLDEVWHVPIGTYDAYAAMADPAVEPVTLTGGTLVVLTGLLRPYKGVDVLLAAWPEVRSTIGDAQLVIAGRPMGVELPEVAPEGATIIPRFLDEDEYAWLLRRADVVCLPYTQIDMSGVLFSALSMGRPMVLSDVGGFAELAGAGAELVPAGDAGALAATLTAVLGDDAHRKRLASEARRAARDIYSWDAIAQQYSELYAGLVERVSGPGDERARRSD